MRVGFIGLGMMGKGMAANSAEDRKAAEEARRQAEELKRQNALAPLAEPC